jgi:hypothetical protein
MSPGHGQKANVERETARHADLSAARQSDPMFGGAA